LKTHSNLRSENGAVLVEFALILPVFCMLAFLIFDAGRAYNYWIDQTHLASEGARIAAVNRVPAGGLRTYLADQATTDELRDGGTDSVPGSLEVCVDFPTDSADGTHGQVGDPVKITVRTQYHWLPIIEAGVTSSELEGSATHRLERTPSYGAGCTS
jgi:TadE-like protein